MRLTFELHFNKKKNLNDLIIYSDIMRAFLQVLEAIKDNILHSCNYTMTVIYCQIDRNFDKPDI